MIVFRFRVSTGEAKCGVTRYEFGRTDRRSQTIMLTELSDNPGMSVTNAFEDIATQLVRIHHLDPFRIIWVENYPRERQREASFDLVTLTWKMKPDGWKALSPNWHRASEELVMELLGRRQRE